MLMRPIVRALFTGAFVVLASFSTADAREAINCKTVADCLRRGQNLLDGRGVERDVDAARKYLAKACEMESPEACFALGRAYDSIVGEAKESIPYYERACELGVIEGCNNAAVYLSKYGNPSEGELARAISVYKKLCDNDIPLGCHNLGLSYYNGTGVAKNEERGRSLIQKACDLRGGACILNLFQDQPSGEARPAAVKYLEEKDQRCEQTLSAGICLEAATLYLKGDGVPRNEQRALEILAQGCDRGEEELCWDIGTRLVKGKQVSRDVDRGIAFLKRGCELGKAFACLDIADLLRAGIDLPAAPEAADRYVERACELGDTYSCTE